jgi:hypothetical protein
MFRNIGKREEYTEILHLGKDVWRIEWDIRPVSDEDSEDEGGLVSWEQEMFRRKPDMSEIKETIVSYFDSEARRRITDGFEYIGRDGEKVTPKLSIENQMDYKNMYDMAVRTGGATLPFIVKYGDPAEASYYEITDLNEMESFYTSMVAHITACVTECRAAKDSVDWSKYSTDVAHQ